MIADTLPRRSAPMEKTLCGKIATLPNGDAFTPSVSPGPRRTCPAGAPRALVIRAHVVSSYATNWLAEHGEMPTGVHKATVRPHPMIYTKSLPVLTVDFTPLRSLASGERLETPLTPA